MFSTPHRIFTTVVCYSETAKSSYGKFASYYKWDEITQDGIWKKIEVPFNDFIPSIWTKRNVLNYPPKPVLGDTLTMFFMFTSFKGDGGSTGSNTVWIDEIVLQ